MVHKAIERLHFLVNVIPDLLLDIHEEEMSKKPMLRMIYITCNGKSYKAK